MTTILGIESTAHTFGVGIVQQDDNRIEILANEKSVYIPKQGSGIHPTEAKLHHIEVADSVLQKALKKAGIALNDTNAIAYSAGPGLPPCLLAGMEFAQKLAKQQKIKLIPVNHCIAHIEIARHFTGMKDPVVVYVSGGNTQIIAYAAKKYRVFGETMDIGIGNAIDTFIRSIDGRYPGGPVLEDLALTGKNYIELPYVVKGMDLCFSGTVTDALRKAKQGLNKNDLAFSFQETIYSMLVEVTERAMAHTDKNECILTGGVAASQRLQTMLNKMCEERQSDAQSASCSFAEFAVCPREYAGDNGAMIAFTGLFIPKKEHIQPNKADFYQKWRTDDVDVSWMK
jgi:N6-L-threonylcarbamoyladenine synthase